MSLLTMNTIITVVRLALVMALCISCAIIGFRLGTSAVECQPVTYHAEYSAVNLRTSTQGGVVT